MIYAVIGHRGTGKSQFLQRVQKYYGERNLAVRTIDLDEEIVARNQKSIEQIFNDQGEQYFRRLEMDVFAQILEETKNETSAVYISLGAGFKGEIPLNVKVLWLKRPTDKLGRVFLNRPRLEPTLRPLDEYFLRAEARERRFQQIYHKDLSIGEGYTEPNEIEPILLGLVPYELKAFMTVMPHIFANEIRLEDFIADKLLLGIERFELRDDLLTVTQMERFTAEVPREKLLFSFRTRDTSAIREDWRWGGVYDWALELGGCPFGAPPILSLHQRQVGESVSDAGARLVSQPAEHHKLAIPVADLMELWEGHNWYLEDPEHRSFLPMSHDGRWNWYRLIHGQHMQVKFVCEGLGSAADQPTLFDWIRVQKARGFSADKKATNFAAILGDPVVHSRTPSEQQSFFAEREWPVVGVRLSDEDMTEVNLGILHRLGLQAAAVTSPLKEKAFEICRDVSSDVFAVKSVNTLRWDQKTNGWAGTNTDLLALRAIMTGLSLPPQLAVWGGGGTVAALSQALPQAKFFSARKGLTRDGQLRAEDFAPQMVIWAVGRGRMDECQFPPANWAPHLIFDLNYGDDSPGREYAAMVNAQYISGLEMFKLQAHAQREFWRKYFVSEQLRPNL